MRTKEIDLGELEAEQKLLQLTSYRGTVRFRSLSVYSDNFGLPEDWLVTHLRRSISERGRVVYVDLGCGDMVALTQAMNIADEMGGNSLRAIGVDILNPHPDKILPELRKYKPEFIKENIDKIRVPEIPDLVTLCHVLQWTPDPLSAIANAAVQLKVGGIICANNLSTILDLIPDDYGRPVSLFKRDGKGYPYFKQINKCELSESIVLQKTDQVKDSDKLLKAWFGRAPRLVSRKLRGNRLNFKYFYSNL